MPISSHYLVDRQHPLPSWYIPKDLIEAPTPFLAPLGDPKRLICTVAYDALKSLLEDSVEEGLSLYGISAYRSYHRQKEIYETSITNMGLEHTNKYIAKPGTSEHQTGLAIDISTPSINYALIEEFANTKEGVWIEKNSTKYGFIISYPFGSEKKTGYQFEPWHIFYTGANATYFFLNKYKK